jgi:hypothetical protein
MIPFEAKNRLNMILAVTCNPFGDILFDWEKVTFDLNRE